MRVSVGSGPEGSDQVVLSKERGWAMRALLGEEHQVFNVDQE